jgi:hypothetical protein
LEGGEVKIDNGLLGLDEYLRFSAYSAVEIGKWPSYEDALAIKSSDPELWARGTEYWEPSDVSMLLASKAEEGG